MVYRNEDYLSSKAALSCSSSSQAVETLRTSISGMLEGKPFAVRVSSELGTAEAKYVKFCNEAFGDEGVAWIMDNYRWEYEFYFAREADAVLFSLKWE